MSHYDDDDNIDNKPESDDEIRGERAEDTAGTASDTQPSEDEEAMNADEDQEDPYRRNVSARTLRPTKW